MAIKKSHPILYFELHENSLLKLSKLLMNFYNAIYYHYWSFISIEEQNTNKIKSWEILDFVVD